MAQTFIYIFYELTVQFFFYDRFERELFKLKDGGTMGCAWDGGIPDPTA